jgi:predicted esterase
MRHRRLGTGALAAVLAATLVGTAPSAPATADAPTPEEVGPAGPDVLRAPPVDAPQLQNTGVWDAEPIGICMTSAYRDGEYVHQGCVYDDEGGGPQYRWPNDTMLRGYTYPEAAEYRRNAADILEVRTQPVDGGTAFRVTMNTMVEPDLTGLTLALGDSQERSQAPFGSNTVMPADVYVTVNGESSVITDAATREDIGSADVTVDLERRQVQVVVPDDAWDPGERTVPVRLAAGLWDAEADRYLEPTTTATETEPGGAEVGDDTPSVFFDSAFRFDEPFEAPYRNGLQRTAINRGDLTDFVAEVDFGTLAAGTDDESGVPTSGYMTRVFATKSEKEQGRRLPSDPGGPPAGSGTQQGGLQTGTGEGSEGTSLQFGWVCRDDCVPDLPGRMQRYMVYVPTQEAPATGYPSLVWTNGYALRPEDDVAGPRDLYRSFADEPGNPTMVIDVDARGNDQWFYGESGSTVFEALADARRHYDLDVERTAAGGFSSGAYGANKLSLQFPDVFSHAFICDGLNMAASFPGVNGVADGLPVDTVTKHEPGSRISPMLPNRRNQPVMEWAGVNDDFIPYNITRERANAYAQGHYDYRFVSWVGAAAEHLVMCKNGMWDLATDFIDDTPRATNPHHVSYVRNPMMDDPEAGLVGDRAYWVSDIETDQRALGQVDVVSRGLGVDDAPTAPATASADVADGTVSPVNPYLLEQRDTTTVPAPARDELEVTASNIRAITVDVERAGVTCDVDVTARTDTPLEVTLLGCDETRSLPQTQEPAGEPDDGVRPDLLAPLREQELPDLPVPPEAGNLPVLPGLSQLPPLRFPPNQEDPTP